ncbi:MAG: DUF885 domain-containing protein [Gemmatimonadetes bacterium]|nr:DUF885 domain-containing protein [Gemmatimonadota bacterium]
MSEPLPTSTASAQHTPAAPFRTHSGTPTQASAAHHLAAITALADRYLRAYFEAFPQEATFAGVADAPHDRLPDVSLTARAHWEATEDALLAELETIGPSSHTPSEAAGVAYSLLCELLLKSRAWRTGRAELWNVSPTWTGWPSVMAQLARVQPVDTPAQRDAALRRFGELPGYIAQEVANLREGLSQGYSAPKCIVRAVIRQIDALLAAPLQDSPIVAMARRTDGDFRARLERLERDSIRSAAVVYRDFLRDEYLPAAREAVGISANPNGEAAYRGAVRYYATVDVSPQEIHDTGLAEIERIRAEMAALARASFAPADVATLLRRLTSDRRYLLSSREEMLWVARGAVERAARAMPRWFGQLPRAAVVVESVPAFQEESAPGGFYTSPAEDGSRPGIYSINLRNAQQQSRAGLEATAFHETYPGHHLQSAIALERDGLHPLSRYIFLSGFGEGWALYSERLADEMGLYSSDLDRIGLLSNEALRAARLVVDSGLHALEWSREQAIDYMLVNTAESRPAVEAEVDRYIAVPGQATAYMLGNLEIRRLRALAEASLGNAFDIRAFHDRLLEDGSVPLLLLPAKIERWLASPR